MCGDLASIQGLCGVNPRSVLRSMLCRSVLLRGQWVINLHSAVEVTTTCGRTGFALKSIRGRAWPGAGSIWCRGAHGDVPGLRPEIVHCRKRVCASSNMSSCDTSRATHRRKSNETDVADSRAVEGRMADSTPTRTYMAPLAPRTAGGAAAPTARASAAREAREERGHRVGIAWRGPP